MGGENNGEAGIILGVLSWHTARSLTGQGSEELQICCYVYDEDDVETLYCKPLRGFKFLRDNRNYLQFAARVPWMERGYTLKLQVEAPNANRKENFAPISNEEFFIVKGHACNVEDALEEMAKKSIDIKFINLFDVECMKEYLGQTKRENTAMFSVGFANLSINLVQCQKKAEMCKLCKCRGEVENKMFWDKQKYYMCSKCVYDGLRMSEPVRKAVQLMLNKAKWPDTVVRMLLTFVPYIFVD